MKYTTKEYYFASFSCDDKFYAHAFKSEEDRNEWVEYYSAYSDAKKCSEERAWELIDFTDIHGMMLLIEKDNGHFIDSEYIEKDK